MNHNTNSSLNSEHQLGCLYAKELRKLNDRNTRVRQALLLDLLGSDRSLLAPLRHLVELPTFDELISENSQAARLALRDSVLLELATWCNQESLLRISAFLDGVAAFTFNKYEWGSNQSQCCTTPSEWNAPSSPEPERYPKTVEHSEAQEPTSIVEVALEATRSGDHQHAISLLSQACYRIRPMPLFIC